MRTSEQITRRQFIKATAQAGAGLTIAFYLGPTIFKGALAKNKDFTPNAFLTVHPDDRITVVVKHFEMGQGTFTGLPMILADELEADWKKIEAVFAPVDVEKYNNLAWGQSQGTGGSTATAYSWDQLRKAGASAREMLISAAALEWKADRSRLRAENGFVHDPKTKRKASYGSLVEQASQVVVPDNPPLKDPKDYKLIGKTTDRLDNDEKVNGKAIFSFDVRRPGQLTALVARSPRFGGKVKSFDAKAAKKIPGVRAVVEIPQGVAVVADHFWSADRGRQALKVDWDDSRAFKGSTQGLVKEYQALLEKPGAVARNDGNADAGLKSAEKVIEADFEFPYLAHAPMETLNCVIERNGSSCEIWAGCQSQSADQAAAARILGLSKENVKIHTLYAGGSFGRRATPSSDYISEAAEILKATASLKAPIHLVWTREDDVKGGHYRPLYLHRLWAGVDKNGKVTSWKHRIVGQSILSGTPFGSYVKDGVDHTSVEGASTLPYGIENLYVDLHSPTPGIPILWWRSVGSTHTAYSTETFLDELAAVVKQDPYEFRKELLQKVPRHLKVLELVAKKAKWGKRLGKNRGMGIALHESFGSVVGQVAEVLVNKDGSYKVERVTCAIDCGTAVNPDQVRAQMEGGIGFGLSAALYSKVTIKDGKVEQSNFHDYQSLKYNEMPEVEVHIVPSKEKPTGVGEPGVPPIAPAVANALFAATGKHFRSLPFPTKV